MLASGLAPWHARSIELLVDSLSSKKMTGSTKNLTSSVESLVSNSSPAECYLGYLLLGSIHWSEILRGKTDLTGGERAKMDLLARRVKTSDSLDELLEVFGFVMLRHVPLNLVTDGFKRFLDVFRLNKENELLVLLFVGNRVLQHFDQVDAHFDTEPVFSEILDFDEDFKADSRDSTEEKVKFSGAEVLRIVTIKFILEVADRLREFLRNSRKFSLDPRLANLIFVQFEQLYCDFEREFLDISLEVIYFLEELVPHVSEGLLGSGAFSGLGINLFHWKVKDSMGSADFEDSKRPDFGIGGARCLDLITDSLSLHEVLFELGPDVMNNSEHLEKIIRQFNNIDTLDVVSSILFFIKDNLDHEDSETPESPELSEFSRVSTGMILFDKMVPLPASKSDCSSKWDLENLAKTLNKIFFTKISWIKIIQSLDTNDKLVLSLIGNYRVFKNFWKYVRQLVKWFKLVVPSKLFNRPWKFYETQKIFLISCFQLLDEGGILILPEEIDPGNLIGSERSSKNLVSELNKAFGFKGLTPAFAQSIKELGPLWCDPTVLTLLVEMSEDQNHSNRISSLLEKSLKNNSQGILIVLFNCKPKEGLRLFQEILESSMKLILNSASNFSELIEAFFNTDKELLALTLAQICERENSFLFLSKILDFSQNIKESLLSLIKSSNHFFSIRLALMAVKREFLRLEYWVNDRLTTCGLEWVESFLRYVHWYLIAPLHEKETSSEKKSYTKAGIEEVLEKSQLTMNAIAIIFENFLLNKQHEAHVGARYTEAIRKMYKRIQELIPQLAQVSINDTDKKANKLLESLYYKNMSIDEFIQHLQSLKVSKSNRDQEILSCIIINIIDEFRFYKNFPKKELLLTAKVFGRVIKNKIIDGKTSSIITKAVMDSLKKDDNMFEFGHMALKIFIDDVELTSSLVNSVVNNKRLLEKDFALVDGLLARLEKEKKLSLVKPDKLERIQARRAELKSKKKFPVLPPPVVTKKTFPKKQVEKVKVVNPPISLKSKILQKKESTVPLKSTLRKSSVEYKMELKPIKPPTPTLPPKQKISEQSLELQKEYSQFKSVIQFMKSRFYQLESKLDVARADKDQITMWFNQLITPVEKSIPDFNKIVTSELIEEWFAVYLVYCKAIGEVTYHKMYNNFLARVNRKGLTTRVYMMTMEAVDQIMRFGRYVDIQSSEDNQYLRNVAKWLGLMTICRNKPILKFKLDIRQRVLEALKTPTVNSFVPILTILIAMGCDSLLFTRYNPYIQSLLDLCRELKMVPSVTTASKNYILLAFKKVQIKDKECHRFRFIDKRTDVLSLRTQNNNMLPMYININKDALMPIQEKQLDEIKQMVIKAIMNSVKTVTKPVLERSVKNAILTTRVLCKKDLAGEADDKNFEKAAEAMVTNLAGNLALVTCKEPLRSQITQKLNTLLWEYTGENKRMYEKIRRSIPEKNLNLACEMVYRRVILNAMEQIHTDEVIRKSIEERRQCKNAGKPHFDLEEAQQLAHLPEHVQASLQQASPFLGEIYSQSSKKIGISNYVEISRGDGLLISNVRGGNDHFESADSNEDTLKRIFVCLEKEICGNVDKERFERINRLFFRMQRTLKDFQGDRLKATKNMTILVFQKVAQLGLEIDKCKAFFDLIGLFHKFNKNISSILAEILANIQEKKKNKLMLASYLFRKNLINLKIFDKAFASRLREDRLAHVNVTVQILKRLVIEEKIFDIQSFPQITEELLKLDLSQNNKALKSGSRIFIKNMSDYLREQTASNRTKFSLSNLETEYSKLRIDLDEYFTNQKEKEMGQMHVKFTQWVACQNEQQRKFFITDFVQNFMSAEPKNNLILIFSYLFERIISQTLQEDFQRPCFKLVDSFSIMVVKILERLQGSSQKIQFLERVLSSLIMVITRHHFFFEEGRRFNQKPFFRILFNLVLEINRRPNFSEEECTNVSIIMIHTLRILQPVKYPGFSFTWLALVSNKFIMRSLLRRKKNENWQNYTMLLNGLMLFFKEAQTKSPPFQMTPQVNKFYKATLFFLLVLAHDFPEYVADQSEFILEEVPDSFKQMRNIILSATPSSIKMPPPRKAGANLSKIEEESPRLPSLPYKIENRVCSMNLNVRLANFFQRMDSKEIENIRDLLYLFDYSGKSTVNKKLVKSFTLYTANFVYTKCSPGNTRNIKKMRSLRKETYKLFLTLLLKDEESLRIVLINSFADNLRFCDFYTVYFIQLLGFIVTDSDHLVLEELVFKILFERFLVGDLHPWGLSTAIFHLFIVSKEFINQKKYYKENKDLFSSVLALIAPNNHKNKAD